MPDLTALEIDARLLALRPGELQRRRRAAHAFELDNVGQVQVAQRALEFFAVRFARGREERLDQIDKIAVRKRFLEKVNRAEPCRLFAMRGKVGAGEDDGPRVRMARAQVVKKLLAQIGDGVDVEDKQIRLGAEMRPWALSKVGATSTSAEGAASLSAARIFSARSRSGSRTRMRPASSAELEDWVGVVSFTIEIGAGVSASLGSRDTP